MSLNVSGLLLVDTGDDVGVLVNFSSTFNDVRMSTC